MARSAAGVRVFSDDGHCVADARLMRRALEYVRAFDGVIAQHAQDPRLAGADACCHEGEISGRLGLPGWPAAARSTIVARDVQLAGADPVPAARLPRLHRGDGRRAALGQGARASRSPPRWHRTICC